MLLTPVVPLPSQESTDLSDPFEPLGRALARRHARVRHVPYTMKFVNRAVQDNCYADLSRQKRDHINLRGVYKAQACHYSMLCRPAWAADPTRARSRDVCG